LNYKLDSEKKLKKTKKKENVAEISFGSYVQMIALSAPSILLGIIAWLSIGELYSIVN
jgi:hypothetical protein